MYARLEWRTLLLSSGKQQPQCSLATLESSNTSPNCLLQIGVRASKKEEHTRQRGNEKNQQMPCLLSLLYTPSPAYLRRPWWFCWIKGLARGQRCFHGNCKQRLRLFGTLNDFWMPLGCSEVLNTVFWCLFLRSGRQCQIDCQQFIYGLVEQQLQVTRNSRKKLHSNHLIRTVPSRNATWKDFKFFPKQNWRFQTSIFNIS